MNAILGGRNWTVDHTSCEGMEKIQSLFEPNGPAPQPMYALPLSWVNICKGALTLHNEP